MSPSQTSSSTTAIPERGDRLTAATAADLDIHGRRFSRSVLVLAVIPAELVLSEKRFTGLTGVELSESDVLVLETRVWVWASGEAMRVPRADTQGRPQPPGDAMNRRSPPKHRTARLHAAHLTALLPLVLLLATAAACGNKQRLPQYDFRGRTLAVSTLAPSHPELLGRVSYRVDPDEPLESLLRVGSAAAFEASAHQARPRLDSAAAAIDVSGRVGARVLDGAARHLRAHPVAAAAGADYELEIRVRRYGIVATSWSAPARFLIDADLFLLDGRSGRRIWRSQVRATRSLRPVVASGDRSVDNAISALTLANMSTAEIQQHLERLADFSADVLFARLVRSLDQARG